MVTLFMSASLNNSDDSTLTARQGHGWITGTADVDALNGAAYQSDDVERSKFDAREDAR